MKQPRKKPPTVCMISSSFLPQIGGVELQLQGLSAALAHNGCTVSILTRNISGSATDEVIEGVPVHRVPILHTNRIIASTSFIYGGIRWLRKSQTTFDILHCHQSYSPATLAVLAKVISSRSKVLVKVTTSGMMSEMAAVTKELPFSSFRRQLLRRVDAFVAISDQIAKEIEQAGFDPRRIIRIPNGVLVPHSTTVDEKARRDSKKKLNLRWKKVAVFTGRLSKEKGLFTLLDAWKRVSDQLNEAGLLVVGNGGPVRNVELELRERALALGLSSRVLFTGHMDDVSPFLSASNVFVLPSFSEGMSNSLLEAMAFARPVIASDIQGNRELVQPGQNGLLFPPGNAAELSDRLLKLLSNSDLEEKMGLASRQVVQDRYSFDHITSRYRVLYQNIMSDRFLNDAEIESPATRELGCREHSKSSTLMESGQDAASLEEG